MKISRTWLQKYFEKPLPKAEELSDALTFHAFEIESVEDDVLDVKVLPNRAADCLSHRGIAKELSAILNIPLTSDPLREPIQGSTLDDKVEPWRGLVVEVDPAYVVRHTGALVRGVTVVESPAWLTEALESVGQRSINNIVDSTNYVMLNIGQPMHAFDARKIAWDKDTLRIAIRRAKKNEKITILSGEEYTLSENMFVIADGTNGEPLDIAGLKGGMASGISESTKDLFISVGNYDGTLIRKMSQALKLFTDASQRYQNRPSPELTAYGMRDLLALIQKIAGGELVGVVDVYPHKQEINTVSVTADKISKHLGIPYTDKDIADVFTRLGLPFKKEGDTFVVTPSFERRDLVIPEDLIEEVGRIIGYDKVPPTVLPAISGTPDQARFRGIEKIKDQLISEGFTEVSTQSFAKKGDVMLANPLDNSKPALRAGLKENIEASMEQAAHYAPLVLGPKEKPKLFEVGTVFLASGEQLVVETSEKVEGLEIKDGAIYQPHTYALGAYKEFSIYPFIIRDIALWIPKGADANDVEKIIQNNAGELLTRLDKFDEFEKAEKTSYAFRLIFQSYERTLSDVEVNVIMEKITAALNANDGWQVR